MEENNKKVPKLRENYMETLKNGIMEHKAEIARMEKEAYRYGEIFQIEKKRRDNITNKESAEFELQDKIVSEALNDLREINEKSEKLKEKTKNTLSVVRIGLERKKEELSRQTLVAGEKLKQFQEEKSKYENFLSLGKSNPQIENLSEENKEVALKKAADKIEKLENGIESLKADVKGYMEQIDEIHNNLEYVDYDKISEYKGKKIDSNEQKKDDIESDNTRKELGERLAQEQVKREKAEKAREEAEANAAKEQADREKTEKAKKEAEEKAGKAEKARKEAEEKAEKAEKAREKAEANAAKEQADRKKAEKAREEAEKAREKAEAEKARLEQEKADREKAEETRRKAEEQAERQETNKPYREGEERPDEQTQEIEPEEDSRPMIYISEADGVIKSYKDKVEDMENGATIKQAFKEKGEIYNRLNIKGICKEIAGKRIASAILYTKINPCIIKALESEPETIYDYIKAIHNKEPLPFKLIHNVAGKSMIQRFVVMRFTRAEKVSGALIQTSNTLSDGKNNNQQQKIEKDYSLLELLDNAQISESQKTVIKDYAIINGEEKAKIKYADILSNAKRQNIKEESKKSPEKKLTIEGLNNKGLFSEKGEKPTKGKNDTTTFRNGKNADFVTRVGDQDGKIEENARESAKQKKEENIERFSDAEISEEAYQRALKRNNGREK